MEIVFNDISFLYKFRSVYALKDAVNTLVDIFVELDKNRKKYQIVFDKELSSIELMDGYYFPNLFWDKTICNDYKRMLLKVFSHIKRINVEEVEKVLLKDGEESSLIGYAFDNGFIVLSMVTNKELTCPFLFGEKKITNEEVNVKNLGDKAHISIHSEFLKIRIYEMNPKHKIGHNWGSPMDLDDTVAQAVLDNAVPYKNDEKCLVNHYNGKYYVFRRHINNCYHGYINDYLPENIKKKAKWT